MGQEVHRQGLIQHTELNGSNVIVDMQPDSFAVSMLEQHLQLHYPSAKIQDMAHQIHWSTNTAKIKINFEHTEDAIHFHLSHSD
jgi:hypothetical protein